MKEIILNEKYKYVYDKELKRLNIHIDGKPCPLKAENLFKFYDTNLNNVAALHENYFWLSKPSDFNDPFDCNVNLIEHENHKELFYDETKPNAIDGIGITCFTEEINELLLWAHYANNYRGFALEFNTETMRVNMNGKKKYSLNPALYFDEFISVKNTDKFAMEYLLTAKSERWKYEKEWRLISTIDETKPYDRIIFYEPIAVKALYIGYRLFDEQQSVFNFIESIFLKKYPNKPIYIVYPNPKKLDMVFQERH